MEINKIKSYEEFYKLGFEYFINKKLIGLRRPKMRQRIFYLSLIAGIILMGTI